MSCDHCKMTITSALTGLPNVRDVEIDLGARRVTVSGEHLDDAVLRSAIEDAGYDVRP
jgi:copper chaperone